MSPVDTRLEAIRQWLGEEVGLAGFDIAPASDDASFRRYLRVSFDGQTRVVMDAPPEREDCRRFAAVSELFHEIGLNVPQVLAADMERGFLLLPDLGTRSYLDALDESSVDRLYGDALGALLVLQACGPDEHGLLPLYDEALLRREVELFREWFLGRHLAMTLDAADDSALDECFAMLVGSALEQPRVCVHRDYHSRNLMVVDRHNPGILDYQDAVIGPVTYDLVSLLRDCYIRWPRERVEAWALGYRDLALQSGVLREDDERQFLRWFDLMGVQRHLKAIGIFARLNHRDGKPGYLGDIPRTLGYVEEVSADYPELQVLHALIVGRLNPALAASGEGQSS